MKRIVSLALALLSLLAALALGGCREKCPPDYVRGTKPVIDNETPYVYWDGQTIHEHRYTDSDGKEWLLKHTPAQIVSLWGTTDPAAAYRYLIKYFGNKIIRESNANGAPVYYTVYSEADYEISYIFLERQEDGAFAVDVYRSNSYKYIYTANVVYYSEEKMLQDGILPQDLPSAILDGRKPSAMYLENHSYEEINQKIDDQWYHFTLHNDSAGLPNPSRAWREKADEKTDGALKKFFRYIHDYGLDTLEERFASSGVYFLDIWFFKDGSGEMTFRHYDWRGAHTLTILQEEVFALSEEEITRILDMAEEVDFSNIPTWNPEELWGFDGDEIYICEMPSNHLISMWAPPENSGIARLGAVIEEIAVSHIELPDNCAWYRKYFS